MSNEGTKKQIRDFLDKAIEKSRNPDPKERVRKARALRAEKVKAQYGL